MTTPPACPIRHKIRVQLYERDDMTAILVTEISTNTGRIFLTIYAPSTPFFKEMWQIINFAGRVRCLQ